MYGTIYIMNRYCKFPDCKGIVRNKEYCNGHYLQLNRGQELRPLSRPPENKICSFEGCEKPARAKGLCQGHRRQQTEGRSLATLRHVNVAAGYKKADGYMMLFMPDYPGSTKSGYILEHRYLMEQRLGRSLHPYENVHHINGVRDDNRIENLELWVRPQPAGQRLEDLIDWMIDNYSTEILQRWDTK